MTRQDLNEIKHFWTLPPYPNFGSTGGGSGAEMRAQKLWEQKYGSYALENAIRASQLIPKLLADIEAGIELKEQLLASVKAMPKISPELDAEIEALIEGSQNGKAE